MKPLYWKFFLIIGAMLVSASLIVPKALRKDAALTGNHTSQTEYIVDLAQVIVQDNTVETAHEKVQLADRVLTFPTIISLGKCGKIRTGSVFLFKPALYFGKMITAGTRPVKLRVID